MNRRQVLTGIAATAATVVSLPILPAVVEVAPVANASFLMVNGDILRFSYTTTLE